MEWVKILVSALAGLAAAIPLVVELVKYVQKAIREKNWSKVLDMVIPALEALPAWEEESLHSLLIGMAEANGMKNGTLLWPVRIAMSGKTVTPGGAIEIAALLGREEALRRLHHGLDKLNNM